MNSPETNAAVLYTFLNEAASWSDFAASLRSSWDRYGSLSPRQYDAARSMMDKCAARARAQAAPRETMDMTPIHAMFEKAAASGLNKLAYRAEGVVITPAKQSGKNPGALYVKGRSDRRYKGKLMNGAWHPVTGEADVTEALRVIAQNPAKAAQEYGKKTGECSCCGRELSDPVSVERGIGPICAANWGL